MKKRSRVPELVSLGMVALMAAPAPVSAERPNLRNQASVEAAVLEAVEADASPVKVLVLAKEASTPMGALPESPTGRRRVVADASTQGLREMLGSEGSEVGMMSRSAGLTYLWAVNGIATEVDRDLLAKLQARDDVRQIVLDRELDWLRFDREEDGAPAEDEASEAPAPKNYGLEKVGALRAWQEKGLTGEGVTVGHIDTGVQASHPALAGKVARFKDFVGQKTEPYDDQGHGTHSAGSIVAEGVGVAPKAKLVVAKALNANGGGSLSGLLSAMQWMLDPDGDPSTDDQPALVSNSWGADKDGLGDGAGVFRDIVVAWREAGIVPVFASGNSGLGSKAVPGGYPEAFAVGATDRNDKVASFSTGGEIEWDGQTFLKPDVSAPGVAIVSTMPDGGYQPMNGTSMACPHAAGAMALLKQALPGASVDQLEDAFEKGALDLGTPGKDARYGEGRIDVMKSLEVAGARGLPLFP